jgi:hypothetical protein
VVGFTTGSRGKVPGKSCEKRIINNNNNKIMVAMMILMSGIDMEL